jgi:hypothetical protein
MKGEGAIVNTHSLIFVRIRDIGSGAAVLCRIAPVRH